MEINWSICFCNNCSEFSDLFDVKHFKRTLQADVRVVSSLPSTHLMSRQTIETKIPYHVSPLWIRSRFFRQVRNLAAKVKFRIEVALVMTFYFS
jgi:hypothetical protein